MAGWRQRRSGGIGARTREIQFTRLDRVSIGAATLYGQPFEIRELGPRSLNNPWLWMAGGDTSMVTPKRELQGLIGYELPARFRVTIDYAAGRMILRNPDAHRDAAGVRTGIRLPVCG